MSIRIYTFENAAGEDQEIQMDYYQAAIAHAKDNNLRVVTKIYECMGEYRYSEDNFTGQSTEVDQ